MTTLAEVARRLNRRRMPPYLPPLILMTDRQRLPDPARTVQRLPRGSAVIVRDPDPQRRRVLVSDLRPLCRARRVGLLVAGDWRLAHTAGCDGVHLPEQMLRRGPRRWRIVRKRGWVVTAAAHSEQAVRRAAAAEVSAVLLAPVFATASHPTARCIGAVRFAAWVRRSPRPVYALGGVDAASAIRLLAARPAGFAAIGALAAESCGAIRDADGIQEGS